MLVPVLLVVVAVTASYRLHLVADGTDLVVTVAIAAVTVIVWAAVTAAVVLARHRRSTIAREPQIVVSTGKVVWTGSPYEIRDAPVRLALPRLDGALPEPGRTRPLRPSREARLPAQLWVWYQV